MRFSYLLLQGWGTLQFYFDGPQASKTSRILGTSYLVHCAYFVTNEVPQLHVPLRHLLRAFYTFLMFFTVLATRESLRIIKRNEHFANNEAMIETLNESFKLKRKLLLKHCLLTVVYCMAIVLCLMFVNLSPRELLYVQGLYISSPEYKSTIHKITQFYAIKEFSEILIIITLIYIWRPRDWPQFFTVEVPEDPRIEGLFP